MKISVITPVYNEQENVLKVWESVRDLFATLRVYDYEHIFTNNCSEDATLDILKSIAAKDQNVKVISFSRNFGYQKSIWTGYSFSTGDAVVQLDADLQDPVTVIPEMLNKWREGYAVVYGIRRTRKEGWCITATRRLFYKVMNYLSDDRFPENVGDFRLVDKEIVGHIKIITNQKIFLRGVIASLGYRQIGISYDRAPRVSGSTKFSLGQLFELAFDGLIMVSDKLLKFMIYAGVVVALLSFLLVCYHIVIKFIDRTIPVGFATLASLISFFAGTQLTMLGIIGEYISHIYNNTNKMPFTIIQERINV